jgi:phosphoglycerate dehydrogenase-like enzyme
MGHVINFSPLPTSAIEAHLGELNAKVVSIRDAPDEIATCRGASVAIADFSGDRRITRRHAAALAGTCKLVVVPSTGTDAIDLPALRAAGIPVATAAGLNAAPVAEWALWATIGGLRHLSDRATGVREGRWEQFGTRFELAGKRVVIVGMGDIGMAVAKRLQPFDVQVSYWTRTQRSVEFEAEHGLRFNADGALDEADVVILCVALGNETQHWLGSGRLATMKSSATVVNAGRAELVDQQAIIAALDEHRLHAYATDVFALEPVDAADPMLRAATIATPHLAGVSVESVQRILGQTLDNVSRTLRGQEPLGLLVP